MLIVMNSWHEAVVFTLPAAPEGNGWRLLIDTDVPDAEGAESFEVGATYEVTGRSLLLFLMERGAESGTELPIQGKAS